ncbi:MULTISPECIES: hypothetical protein [unclassified Moorena]|uniref:hypothetical protein n=1 Tax=unclassified Moorena TaxID=2683338 RepID=UPI0013C9D25F|nr:MULTISPECIES: hypothetical protein [unclassified Moorena]NEP30966.1 hypothetical protein [Moorena sp. SIO3B2]
MHYSAFVLFELGHRVEACATKLIRDTLIRDTLIADPDSRFPIPVPLLGGVRGGFRFPIPNSRFPIPDYSQFPTKT